MRQPEPALGLDLLAEPRVVEVLLDELLDVGLAVEVEALRELLGGETLSELVALDAVLRPVGRERARRGLGDEVAAV